MNSPHLARRLLVSALSVLALVATTSGLASGAPTPLDTSRTTAAEDSVAADATFTDDFDGSAGSAVDGSKWQIETGDNVDNHERQYYTSGNKNAALDGQGHLVITARKENPSNYQC
ncbi:glycoside hydrolase family 16 protein, partial [Streptomyces sp. A1277]